MAIQWLLIFLVLIFNILFNESLGLDSSNNKITPYGIINPIIKNLDKQSLIIKTTPVYVKSLNYYEIKIKTYPIAED